eukprot:905702-Prorocentrum_minimum.AAC.1
MSTALLSTLAPYRPRRLPCHLLWPLTVHVNCPIVYAGPLPSAPSALSSTLAPYRPRRLPYCLRWPLTVRVVCP